MLFDPLLPLSHFGMFLFVMVPAAVAWLLLGYVPRVRRFTRIVLGALIGGMVSSGAIMWEDGVDGFCCREYHATAWTELPMYALQALSFAVLSAAILALCDLLTRKRNG